MKIGVKRGTYQQLSRLLERIATPGVEHRIQGLLHSSGAWALCKLASTSEKPLLVLCRNEKEASSLREDLQTLDSACFEQKLSPVYFPHWDASLRHSIAPSIRVRLARAAVLARLSSAARPRVVVTTLAAAAFATLPPEEHKKHSLPLLTTPRDSMIRGLSAAGYLRTDSCDDPGTFSVRGDLIDVFPVDRDLPLRIEYFGDELERVREFDPKSQRSEGGDDPSLREITIFPARETLLNLSSWERVKRLARERADELNLDRRARDPLLGALAQDVYPEHSEGWAQWSYERPSSLRDYADFDCVCVDSLSVQTEWEKFTEEEARLERESETEGKGYLLLPRTAELYRDSPWVGPRGEVLARVHLDALSLDEGRAETFKAGVQTLPLSGGAEARLKAAAELIASHSGQRFRCLLFTRGQSQMGRLRYLLEQHHVRVPAQLIIYPDPLSAGFLWPEEGLLVLSEDDLLPPGARAERAKKQKRESRSQKDWSGLQALSDLAPEDLVVHNVHGIGRYIGMTRVGGVGAQSDFLHIEYAGKDRLYIPVYRLNVIQKYAGGQGAAL